MKKSYGKVLAVGLAMAFCVLAGNAEARVSGVCSDCHTMHNSQDGGNFGSNDGTPDRALTSGDCVGCHSGAALLGGTSNNIPVVKTDAAPGNGIGLAGGNFYWVGAGTNNKGHNVVGINDADVPIGTTPPGWSTDVDFAASSGNQVAAAAASWGANQLTCAGIYGCHGGHGAADDFADISGAHHADDATIDGSAIGKSFRFLYGVLGVEDDDWENETAVDHNVYMGEIRTSDAVSAKTTMSFLCAECHGNFHSQNSDDSDGISGSAWNSPWVRHPTDIKLPETGEYGSYNPTTGYQNDAPVAYTVPGVPARAQAVVMCLSCHRAHGSNYADLLRWDYSTMNAGGGGADTGCFRCHTTKN